MSHLETDSSIDRQYQSYSVNDSLAFNDWPDEQRRIARAFCKNELEEMGEDEDAILDAREEGEEEGKASERALMDAEYEKAKEIHAQIAQEVRAMRASLPPELSELDSDCASILAHIADLPGA